MARPFFSYYGSKWNGSRHYGAPRHDLVIEPFAGSAAYSVRWNCRNVRLYDISKDMVDLWSWLIACNADDILSIPASFEAMDEVLALDRGPQLLARFWVSKGRCEPSNTLSPWYFQWRSSNSCKVWGEAVKRRVADQKWIIERWTVEQLSWDAIPLSEAHWHVDPPYNNAAGSRYPNSKIDFDALGNWCQSLPGHVDVCENEGADWLPFQKLYESPTLRGKRNGVVSSEVVWRRY